MDNTRSIYTNSYKFEIKCDRNRLTNNTWYRFTGGNHSQMMAVGRVAMVKCGTVSPGWLTTSHPSGNYDYSFYFSCFFKIQHSMHC